MTRRILLRLALLLSFVLGPIGMSGEHAAMALPVSGAPTAASAHCADMPMPAGETSDKSSPSKAIDCMMACACVPATAAGVAEQIAFRLPAPPAATTRLPRTRNPAADPPPPRLS